MRTTSRTPTELVLRVGLDRAESFMRGAYAELRHRWLVACGWAAERGQEESYQDGLDRGFCDGFRAGYAQARHDLLHHVTHEMSEGS